MYSYIQYSTHSGALYRYKNDLVLHVRPPAQTTYYVSIFGRWVGFEDEQENNVTERVQRDTTIKIASWKLDARKYAGASGLNGRFPEARGNEYGRSELAILKDIRSNIENGVILSENGI